MKAPFVIIVLLGILLAAATTCYGLPNWGAAYNYAIYNCQWIESGEPLPQYPTADAKNAKYTSALMILAGAGWCCKDPDLDDGCDYDLDGTRDVVPDDVFQNTAGNTICYGTSSSLWDLIVAPIHIIDGLYYSEFWFTAYHHPGGSSYWSGLQWPSYGGPSDSASSGDIVTWNDASTKRAFVVVRYQNDWETCVECDVPPEGIGNLIENAVNCRLYSHQGPIGAAAGDLGRSMRTQRGGKEK